MHDFFVRKKIVKMTEGPIPISRGQYLYILNKFPEGLEVDGELGGSSKWLVSGQKKHGDRESPNWGYSSPSKWPSMAYK